MTSGCSEVARVLVINPNSSSLVTQSLRGTLGSVSLPHARFVVEQIDRAPRAIATPADHRQVAPLVVQAIQERTGDYDAVVIACHGDPGLKEARRDGTLPILGIGETSFYAAAAITSRFAVLTLSDALVERKWDQIRAAGVHGRCVAVLPTGTTVEHAVHHPDPDPAPYLTAGRAALQSGAQVLVLGCAGMSPVTEQLAAALDVPVIDPVTATARIVANVAGARHSRTTLTTTERCTT